MSVSALFDIDVLRFKILRDNLLARFNLIPPRFDSVHEVQHQFSDMIKVFFDGLTLQSLQMAIEELLRSQDRFQPDFDARI